MKKKMWGGRFRNKTDPAVEAYTASVSFDRRLAEYDISGSIAHARMLGRCGIIPRAESREIIAGLKGILADVRAGKFRFKDSLEDVHLNIEAALTKRVGEVGAKLHTARSRNDQVALDMRMYMRDEIGDTLGGIGRVRKAVVRLAEKYLDAVMPGFTHVQHAQPVYLSHHMLAYDEMFARDTERFEEVLKRTNVMPLGSCALAGTSFPIDRDAVGRELGFDAITANSMDAVSDRDYLIEFCAAASICMMHLSRLAEELVLWSSSEFAFCEIDDRFATGSSVMPQKKNPDVAELARGKTGRVYGNLVNLLTVMKAMPLSYNRDLQEDKEAVFDTADTLKSTLNVFAPMLAATKFDRKRVRAACAEGFPAATEMADYLVRKGIPFRTAHEIVGGIVLECIENGLGLDQMPLETLKEHSESFAEDIYPILAPEAAANARDIPGGTSLRQVRAALRRAKRQLGLGKTR